jgi:regulator of RNase E activity RraA
MENRMTSAEIEQFSSLSTPVVASAIETFRIRLPNTGFCDSTIRCIYEDRPPIAGYAATARIRTSNPPMEGHGYSYERTDWWKHILTIPSPRVVVMEDVDKPTGVGAFVGEVNANILLALGCVAVVTNGAVRDLNEVRSTVFQMFAGNVSVSHAYAHIFDFGGPVVVGGMTIRPGELVHGDVNGVQKIPLEIVAQVPSVAHKLLQRRQRLIQMCRSAKFSVDELHQAIDVPDFRL